MCWHELRRSFSRELFCASLQRLVPEIQPEDLVAGGAGVRAQAMAADGSLVEDFHFVEGPGELHVVNAPSPGRDSIARDRRRNRREALGLKCSAAEIVDRRRRFRPAVPRRLAVSSRKETAEFPAALLLALRVLGRGRRGIRGVVQIAGGCREQPGCGSRNLRFFSTLRSSARIVSPSTRRRSAGPFPLARACTPSSNPDCPDDAAAALPRNSGTLGDPNSSSP